VRASAADHKWTIYFLMAVGFWNFVGAGVFGFLINLPIVSYFEVGTLLTANTAMGPCSVSLDCSPWRCWCSACAPVRQRRLETNPASVKLSFWGST